jgi:hypothetical protein
VARAGEDVRERHADVAGPDDGDRAHACGSLGADWAAPTMEASAALPLKPFNALSWMICISRFGRA